MRVPMSGAMSAVSPSPTGSNHQIERRGELRRGDERDLIVGAEADRDGNAGRDEKRQHPR